MEKLHALCVTLKDFRDRYRKDTTLLLLLSRLIEWLLMYGGGIRAFFSLKLFLPENKPTHILTIRQYEKIRQQLSPRFYMCLLEDKLVFDRYIRSFGFPVATTLGILDNGMIQWFSPFQREPIENITVHALHCYVKILTKWGGMDVHILEVNGGNLIIDRKTASLEDFKQLTSNGIYMLQDTVIQHPDLQNLNPSCVNTLRLVTIDDGIQVHNLSGILRTGTGNSITDNATLGGLGCGIGDDGYLMKEAFDGLVRIDRHPDSGICFDGFRVPWYAEARELTRKMHMTFHCFFMIAWDIAVTASGPVVIEANPIGDIIYIQHFSPHIKGSVYRYAEMYRKNRDAFLREFVFKDKDRL